MEFTTTTTKDFTSADFHTVHTAEKVSMTCTKWAGLLVVDGTAYQTSLHAFAAENG